MIVIGDPHIPYECIEKISSVDDISKTKPNATVLFDFDFDILNYCQKNDVATAVMVKTIIEVVYSALLGAKYIIVPDTIVSQAQKIADNYMYDSKILAVIQKSQEIEKIALAQIDGIVYKNIL